MINVDVFVSGIIMCCNQSIIGLDFGNGYCIEKCEFNELPFKDKIVDGRQKLDIDYYGSRIINNDKVYFMCLKKKDSIAISGPQLNESQIKLTEKDLICDKELTEYMDNEMKYLNEKIYLLRLFKEGNIGFKQVFFNYKFSVLGDFIKSNIDKSTLNMERNVIDNKLFTLSTEEITLCNQWINRYCGNPYKLLKDNIKEFCFAMEQLDIPTGFEQYTTVLEMTLLPANQNGKKQMLANRISVMLGNTEEKVRELHEKIKKFYSFRSESLHEGNGSNITKNELYELQNITRSVLKKCLMKCKIEYDINSNVSWEEVKTKIMHDLVTKVVEYKELGILQ